MDKTAQAQVIAQAGRAHEYGAMADTAQSSAEVNVLSSSRVVMVTGGMGFIGRYLVNALLDLGKEVVVLDNLSTAVETEVPDGVRLVRADIRDTEQIRHAMDGVEVVFHTAANANGSLSVREPRFDFTNNTCGSFNVLEASIQAGAKRLVYMSSASVYGRPQRFPMDELHPTRPFVPYGASKLAGEALLLAVGYAQGLSVVVGRPFCVWGPGEHPDLALVEVSRYMRWHLRRERIQIVGDPERKTRDFVHVSDLVQGLLLLAERGVPGESYNIGSGSEISMRQLVDAIGEVTGRPVEVEALTEITEDTYRLVGSIDKLQALGYEPKMSLAEGLKQLADSLGEDPKPPGGVTIFKVGQQAEHTDPGETLLSDLNA